MNPNEVLERTLTQARELHSNLSAALSKNAEQVKPVIEQSLTSARELQETLTKHAVASEKIVAGSAEATQKLVAEHTKATLERLREFISVSSQISSQAAQQTSEQAHAAATKLIEHSRKIVESATAAAGKKSDDGNR
ncbi:MAG TPA: hypothetical protein VGZ00_01295 [Candidatus Baltobacteraceae bacterium]|nr:hypothetical protein [Candidatus Baltobacteraceae bacterium]